MKSLPHILGLAFLGLTLTNCSGQLSSEQIAPRLKPSIVRLFYKNQPGHGTGFFVSGEPGVCTVLTAAHVVKKEGERLLQTRDGIIWQVANNDVKIFPSDIDLALVTFKSERGKCNYPALKIGNSESLTEGNSIYISGFPNGGLNLEAEFVLGNVTRLDTSAQGYGVSYDALTLRGMSGAPVVDVNAKVVAVHGKGKDWTFSRGIPINWFREYRGEASDLDREKPEDELQRQLEEEQRKRQELEQRVQQLEAEKQKQQENQILLFSSQGLDYTKLRDLLVAGNWKEADLETQRVMLRMAGGESEEWSSNDVENLSCQDLKTIDQLWVKHSKGKFGFSVQKKIYQSLGGTNEYNSKVWRAFGDKVGWRKGEQWLGYNSLTFSDQHDKGHLPGFFWWRVASAASSAMWKLTNCNI